MRRISASCLRFVLVVYVYVHSLQQSRALLELLASMHLRRVAYCIELRRGFLCTHCDIYNINKKIEVDIFRLFFYEKFL